MRRISVIVALAVAASSLVAAVAHAGNAVRIKGIDLSGTFAAPDLSAECGTPVWFTFTGTLNVTLITNREGDVVKEIDTLPGARVAFTAPATGGSFSFPESEVARFVYPEGGTVGAPALVYVTGMLGHAPRITADAGRLVWEGVVFGVTPEGIPLVELTNLRDERGNREDGVIEAICAALT